MNHYSSFFGALGGALLGAFSLLHPWAATGAMFGCLFFIASQPALSKMKKALLTVVSWGAGYSCAVWMYGEGPPWSQKAMIIGFIGSALAVVVTTSVSTFIQNGGQLPPWLDEVLERIPFLPKKGGR